MEKNGESHPSSMVVDPVSPASNTSEIVLDEPAAPRRNSTDDNDTTRPRKRLAAMAVHDDQRVSPADPGSPRPTAADRTEEERLSNRLAQDEAQQRQDKDMTEVPFADENSPPKTWKDVSPDSATNGSKITIHIRASHLAAPGEAGAETPTDNDEPNDEQSPPTLSPSEHPRSPDSLQGDSPSPRSPSVEVEEVQEMEEDEDLTDQITVLDDYIKNSTSMGDPQRVKQIMDNFTEKLERDPCPILQLDEMSSCISEFVLAVGDEMNRFLKCYLANKEIWVNLPNLVETLLKRTDAFANSFSRRINDSPSGLETTAQLLLDVVRVTVLFIRYDVWVLQQSSKDAEVTVISRPYQRIIFLMLRTSPLFTLFSRAYNFNLRQILPEVLNVFNVNGGLESLKQFGELILERVPVQPKLLPHVSCPVEMLVRHIRALDTIIRDGVLAEAWYETKTTVLNIGLEYLNSTEVALTTLLESHIQSLGVKEFLSVLDSLFQLANIIYSFEGSDPRLVCLLQDKLHRRYQDIDASELPVLADFSIRFSFLWKMLTSNRMDFRLAGLMRATDQLVKAWRDFCGDDWRESTILRYLADFILDKKVIEYVMGPESHPELIRRSANITGFLMVTGTITPEIRDALWQPVVDNKDPRIVQATLVMYQEMIGNMSLELVVELCEKVSSIPFSSFDSYMIDFVSRLLEATKTTFYQRQQVQGTVMRLDLAPYEMLIRLIRAASNEEEKAAHDTGLSASAVFDFAAKELMSLAEYGPTGDLRRNIFLECVGDIKEMNASATGSINVIAAFLQKRPRNHRAGSHTYSEDIEYLTQELNLPELLVNEIAAFIDSHRDCDKFSRIRRLKARLLLLQFIVYHSPECLSRELGKTLWIYLVGEKALGTSERDHGFEFYNVFAHKRPDSDGHPILENVFRDYFPALEPAYFSPSTLEFCKKSLEYLNRTASFYESADETVVVEIPGIEQLWRIILRAPDEKLAEEATTFLVNLYLDSTLILQKSPQIIEATHFKIVERCIRQLTAAASTLGGTEPSAQEATSDEMPIDTPQVSIEQNSIDFSRSLDVLDELVRGYRSRSKYNVGVQRPGQLSEVEHVTGVPLTVRLRLHALNSAAQTTAINIGNLDTGQDLHNKIIKVVGGEKYRSILLGREIKLSDEPLKTLSDFGITDGCVLLISKTPDVSANSNSTANTVSVFRSKNLNALQVEVMRHFDALYELLGLPEPQGIKIWIFLRNFPAHERITNSLISGTQDFELFPVEQPYKILYSLYGMRACFEEVQRQENNEKEGFVRRAISYLLSTIMRCNTGGGDSLSLNTTVVVTSELLDCLRIFLHEPIPEKGSSDYFPDAGLFVDRLFTILETCTTAEECLTNAFNVLMEASRIDDRIWSCIIRKSSLTAVLDRLLLGDARPSVRQGVANSIIAICSLPSRNETTNARDFAEFFWSILKDILAQNTLNSDTSSEFFGVAYSVLKNLGEIQSESLDLGTYFHDWSCRLVKHQVAEFVGRPKEDHIVTGYAKLLQLCAHFCRNKDISIKNLVGEDIFQNIFQNLLFPPITTPSLGAEDQLVEKLPCLHSLTRTEVYALLLELASDPKGCARVIRLNQRLFLKDQYLVDGFHADRSRWARSIAGHVGLQNMSNTCYLNSLVTQLYMNRPFRAFILDMPVNECDESQKLLYFMKVLFARMQNSYTKAIEPRDFVEAISDYEGEQIDVSVQMDVDEFFNLIFDRLEGQMTSMELKASFRGHYGGHLVQQVKSKECPHISERTEPFSAIQCDIKGKSNLQESLKAYVEGEFLEGDNKYSCGTCNRHVDAVKRTCLKDIPDHLILHLKRFEFDLQTMHRSKINDFFEFPLNLDMRPYTMEYLSENEGSKGVPSTSDMFELVGVLVHSGTAESGHYYSYIRDRLSPSMAPEWFEFNDSEVVPFDSATIPNACYGGCDSTSIGQAFTMNKPYSAYMLFYERSSSLESRQSNSPLSARMSIPRDIEIEIHRENQLFIRKFCMFDNNHIEFVRRLLEQQYRLSKHATITDHSFERKALVLGLETLEQIATRFKDSTEADALFSVLESYISRCLDCCQVFSNWLCSKEESITNLLVCNPYQKVRQQFSKLVLISFGQIRRAGQIDSTEENDSEDQGDDAIHALRYSVLEALYGAWSGLQYSIRAWNDYFGLLATIASSNDVERTMMLEIGCLGKVLQTLLMDVMPAPRKQEYAYENFAKLWIKRRPPLGRLAELFAALMKACDPNQKPISEDESRSNFPRSSKLPLTQYEFDLFVYDNGKNSMTALTKMLEHPGTTEILGPVISGIVGSEKAIPEGKFLAMIKDTLLTGVPVDPAHEAFPFLRCLLYYILASKSERHIREIVRRVSEEVPTIGTDGGQEHLHFFRDLLSIANQNIGQSFIRNRVIEHIQDWAPPLLVYCDAGVRDDTEALVNELLFTRAETAERPKARKAVEELMKECFTFVETKFPKHRQICDEETFEHIIRVLEACGEYQDEETFRARMDVFRQSIERLLIEDNDAEVASDDWGGSELGSDTHEMEVQLEDYST